MRGSFLSIAELNLEMDLEVEVVGFVVWEFLKNPCVGLDEADGFPSAKIDST